MVAMIMTMVMAIVKTVTFCGKQFGQSLNLEARTGLPFEESIPAAKSGTLTVRTDANTGSLTMSSGHGITTGARLDLYWVGGCRRGIVVGTVATNVVPIDLGSGDDLPSAATAITAMVPTNIEFEIVGDDAVGIVFNSAKRGQLTIIDETDSDAEVYYSMVEDGGQSLWHEGDGTDNPAAGANMTKAFVSHGHTAAVVMKFGILNE
jgi:hypothetical protein